MSADTDWNGSGMHANFSTDYLREVGGKDYFEKLMAAFEAALGATSRPWAPWYAIPADSKSYMRMAVAEIIADSLKQLKLSYPKVGSEAQANFKKAREALQKDD